MPVANNVKRAVGLRYSLGRGIVGAFALRVAGVVGQFVTAIVLARLLGVENFGRYSFAVAMASVLTIPASLGFQGFLTREVAAGLASGSADRVKVIVRQSVKMTGVFSFFIASFVFCASWAFSLDEAMMVAAWLIPGAALGMVFVGILNGLHRTVTGQLFEYVLRPWPIVVFGCFFLWEGWSMGTIDMIEIYVTITWAAMLVMGFLVWSTHKWSITGESSLMGRTLITKSFPFAAIGVLGLINGQLDLAILGMFLDATEVGVFRVASQGALLVAFMLSVVNVPLQPLVANLFALNERIQLQRAVQISARLTLIAALFVVCILAVAGGDILSIFFGEEFRRGAVPLTILAIGQLVNAGSGSVGIILNMTGNQHVVVKWLGVVGGASIPFYLFLIPSHGMVGAAVVTAVMLALWNLILVWEVARRISINPTAIPLPRFILRT